MARREPVPPHEPDCLEGLILAIVLLALAFSGVLLLAPPTPQELANLHDAMGKSTHVRWR